MIRNTILAVAAALAVAATAGILYAVHVVVGAAMNMFHIFERTL